MEKWYTPLIEKIKKTYNQLVIVKDLALLSKDNAFTQELSLLNYALIDFSGELSLRRFIRQHKSQQILIFISNEGVCLPYDIQRSADCIDWSLADAFPRFNSKVLNNYSRGDFQTIYEVYQATENSLGFLNETQTMAKIAEWVKDGKISVQPKIYSEAGKNNWLSLEARKDYNEVRCLEILRQIKDLLTRESVNWGYLALLYGELQSYHPSELSTPEIYWDLDCKIEEAFTELLTDKYEELFFASYQNGPVVINQVMSYLASLNSRKIALLCFDGMGFAEWLGLKKYLVMNQLTNYKERELFALIPTLTSVSRNALFTGETAREKMTSETIGFSKAVESYFKDGKKRTRFLFMNTDAKWNPDYLNYELLGIIFNIIDHVGHKTVLLSGSKKNMHIQLEELYPMSQIAQTIRNLRDENYRVFITADHGSIWCFGNGVASDKYLVEERARRALIYPNKILAEDFAQKNNVRLWENKRILGNKVLVLAHGRETFHSKNKLEISHGGISIEEVIIPFVEVLQ